MQYSVRPAALKVNLETTISEPITEKAPATTEEEKPEDADAAATGNE